MVIQQSIIDDILEGNHRWNSADGEAIEIRYGFFGDIADYPGVYPNSVTNTNFQSMEPSTKANFRLALEEIESVSNVNLWRLPIMSRLWWVMTTLILITLHRMLLSRRQQILMLV